MALIECVKCGKMISSRAEVCPACGCLGENSDMTEVSVTGSNRVEQLFDKVRTSSSMVKNVSIIGIVIGVIMIIGSFIITVPDSEISMYGSRQTGGYEEYVGGDAYNIQIEASIRGGEIAGTMAARASYMTGGIIVLIGSLFVLGNHQGKPNR